MDECAIYKVDVNKYGFYDYPEPDFPDKDSIVMIVDSGNATGVHKVVRSIVWDDVTGFVDELQDEEKLPDGFYIVCYYVPDENLDLLQVVDYGITKAEIIQNVRDQKYREGASYYLLFDEGYLVNKVADLINKSKKHNVIVKAGIGFCPECKQALTPFSNFCHKCGNQLTWPTTKGVW